MNTDEIRKRVKDDDFYSGDKQLLLSALAEIDRLRKTRRRDSALIRELAKTEQRTKEACKEAVAKRCPLWAERLKQAIEEAE